MDKDRERRKSLASLPFSEKLKVLEKLRDRSRAIAASGLRKTAARQQGRNTRITTAKPILISDENPGG